MPPPTQHAHYVAVTAIAFACGAGFMYGALGVAVRLALQRMPQIGVASVAINLLALAVTAIIAAASGATVDDLDLSELWPFIAIGAVIPGVTQILYVGAVETAGATRAQVILATSPLLAALLAVGLLGEAWNAALVVGTILVVLGGMALAWDRARPTGFRAIGIVLAGATAIAIGSRDTATRWAFTETEGNPALKAGVAIAVGVTVAAALSLARSQTRFSLGELHQAGKVFALSGALMAGSYVLGFEALDRGCITLVSPLIGTYALWTVLLSAAIPRAAEAVSKRLVLATAFVAAGAALVTSFREGDVPVPARAAVAAFRAEATTEHTRPQHPPAGVYVYDTEGSESIDLLLGTTHEYPNVTTTMVRYSECGFVERWDALAGRATERHFCVTESGLELTLYADRHEFLGRVDRKRYACDQPALVAPAQPTIGEAWTFSCTAGAITETWHAAVVGLEAAEIDGKASENVHVRFRTELVGPTHGTSTKELWLRTSDHALVRERIMNGNSTRTAVGDVRYVEQYERRLAEREPRR